MLAFAAGQYVLNAHPDLVVLHTETTLPLPDFAHPLGLMTMVTLSSVGMLWYGWVERIPFWGVSAACALAGGAANMGSLLYYGGVPDFLPVRHLLLSVGDVYIGLSWLLMLLGGFLAIRRERRTQAQTTPPA